MCENVSYFRAILYPLSGFVIILIFDFIFLMKGIEQKTSIVFIFPILEEIFKFVLIYFTKNKYLLSIIIFTILELFVGKGILLYYAYQQYGFIIILSAMIPIYFHINTALFYKIIEGYQIAFRSIIICTLTHIAFNHISLQKSSIIFEFVLPVLISSIPLVSFFIVKRLRRNLGITVTGARTPRSLR